MRLSSIILLLALLGNVNIAISHDLEEGLQAGKEAREALNGALFSQQLTETLNDPALQKLLNQLPHDNVDLDPTALPSSSANAIIQGAQNEGRDAVNRELHLQNDALKRQQEIIEQSGLRAASFGAKPIEQSLTPNQIVNQNVLQMETFPNARNLATEPLFQMVESTDKNLPLKFDKNDLNLSLQTKFVLETVEEKQQEFYEMGCSTTLLGNELGAASVLEIQTVQAMPPGTKTITADFSAYAFNLSHFQIDFKLGTVSSPEGGVRGISFSDTLGEAFGPSTSIKLIKKTSWDEEGGVRHTLYQHPTVANGFIAGYQAFQPKTGKKYRRHEWKVRGGNLIYQFSDIEPRLPVIVSERWIKNNEMLEDLVRINECRYLRTECIKGPLSKSFGSHAPFLNVERSCWEERLIYHCNVPEGDNDCGNIPKECIKIGSEFIDFLGQHAVEVHRFRCERGVTEPRERIKSLGGNLIKAGEYQKNNDIKDAIAGLNIAKEIAAGFRGEARGSQGQFFKGTPMECTSKPKQCCSDSKSFWKKLTGCRESEQLLALQISKGVCHEVGTYRVKNSLLQKIGHVDKKGFCCFQSKLSRIIQEGAKQQLPNINWGTPEQPNCRALTLTEIQRIDWSLIDFSEIAKDFMDKAKNTSLSQSVQLMIQNQLSAGVSKAVEIVKKDYPSTPLGTKQSADRDVLQQKIKEGTEKRRLQGITP